jgi:hypothetical protein
MFQVLELPFLLWHPSVRRVRGAALSECLCVRMLLFQNVSNVAVPECRCFRPLLCQTAAVSEGCCFRMLL